jgi:hypothetical protein
MLSLLRSYLQQLNALRASAHATDELSLRDALSRLLKESAAHQKHHVLFIGEGKMIRTGRPDYIIARGDLPIGYIEAEKYDSDLDNLSGHAKTQNQNFIADLDNFLLTNHRDFRLFSGGKAVARFQLPAHEKELEEKHAHDWEAFFALLLSADVQPIQKPEDLARVLARRAAILQRAVRADVDDDGSYSATALREFQEQLLPNISKDEFADLYAQTLAYGLFAARCLVENESEFSVQSAAKKLKIMPLLASLFHEWEFQLPQNLEWVLREIETVLKQAPIDGIREYFQKRSGRRDPMIDFYEPFLQAYDPRQRELRGVYYTPEAVVSYIVRSLDALLQSTLGRENGLCDADVKILDPATGTGSFLFAALDEIHRQMELYGTWKSDVYANVLPRLFGLELMVAPYTIAHLKLALQLDSWSTPPQERLGIYLSNSLDDARQTVRGNYELGREVEAAADIKERKEILVVLGNPPYSGHSANLNYKEGKRKILTAVGRRLESYKTVDGAPLGEKNPKWLNDDYVKFIAFAQNRIERTGEGIVAFITNHGYLDNPTFRGLRAALLQSFDALYLLDLHGNVKKKEVAPDGGKDENVFDIQQGVAILLAVKTRREKADGERATVHHADLWGTRKDKYDALSTLDVTTTNWQQLTPTAPHYLFVLRDETLLPEYENGWKVTDIFPVTLLGPNSHRDHFAISFDAFTASQRLTDMSNPLVTDEAFRNRYGLVDNRDWQLEKARKKVINVPPNPPVECIYRPFDFRFMLYGSHAFDYHRPEINDHLLNENLALITTRQSTQGASIFSSRMPAGQHKLATPYDGSYISPLYLYESNLLGDERRANFSEKFITELSASLGVAVEDGLPSQVSPEAIFGYIYATLHSPRYRARYAAFLKTDFPRVPRPSSPDEFARLSTLGLRLVALHTLDVPAAAVLGETRFAPFGDGANIVERATYDAATQQLRFNATRGFAGVPASVWEFKIGGYQVAKKWLDDRKGRVLAFADLKHFQKTLIALEETQKLMAQIDEGGAA